MPIITAKSLGRTHLTATVLVPDVPNQLHPPIPPWRVHLQGEERDLRDLTHEHSTGRTRIIQANDDYFLESQTLNRLTEPNQVYKKAKEILDLIIGLAKVRRFVPSRIEAVSVLWTDGHGNWVCRMLVASEPVWSVPGTRYLEGPEISARLLELAEANEVVGINLVDFIGEWDFSRLRRITRGILLNVGGSIKSGVDEVRRLGWVTEHECDRFDQSVNFGDKDHHGAHSPLELTPGQNEDPMNLVEAAEFVRKLLVQWMASKINSEVTQTSDGVRLHVHNR